MSGSLALITLFFLLTTVLVQIDTDNWQNTFFIITMVTVVIINGPYQLLYMRIYIYLFLHYQMSHMISGAGAIFGGSLFGIAGKFSPQYMASVVNGQALGGIIAAVAQILSLTFKVSAVHSAFIYFIIGDVLIIFSLCSYLYISKIDYFNFYNNGTCNELGISANNRMMYVSNKQIMKKIWVYSFSLGLVFFTTTCVYPGVTVLIESHHSGAGGDWNSNFFF